LTDPAFGFGLKWAEKSAKLCAKAIHENKNYNKMIQTAIIPDFSAFQIMRKFFETAESKDYDAFVKSFKNPLVGAFAGAGKSLLPLYVRKRLFRA
jgi:flavin-dependent dehydrogenase